MFMEALNDLKSWLLQNKRLTSHTPTSQRGGRQVLFTGANQPAKLVAAQKLAQEAGKELFRVNLSQVVGQYIGETEKNLATVFEKAANEGAVLFFDEADALFGKRTTVKDAHDRYANIDVNYMLQKMESYPGLVIVSVNAKANIDSAFMRRIRSVVELG